MQTISTAQRWKILQLWSRVCKERGWKSSDRALRLATIGNILGARWPHSMTWNGSLNAPG
jgi:hypothetical protein